MISLGAGRDGDARAGPPTVESLARKEEPLSMNKPEPPMTREGYLDYQRDMSVAKSTRVER